MPPSATRAGPLSINGFGTEGEWLYVRYGPNISQARAEEEELGCHESRHVDQWGVANLLAGTFAFPAAYFTDVALFPHRATTLSGTPACPGAGPAPAGQLASAPVAGYGGHRRTRSGHLPATTAPRRPKAANGTRSPGVCRPHSRLESISRQFTTLM